MKIWQKVAIVGLALSALLLISIGGTLAGEKIQTVTVYTHTATLEQTFTAHSEESGWSWSIDVHGTGTGELDVYDLTRQEWIFEKATSKDESGSINIVDGHQYRVHTWQGSLPIPGDATCSVYNTNWFPERPGNP